MIDRLVITDFQCHEKLDVRLRPGVTAIIGPSDAGKSSVLRALKWLALNSPAGAEFVRHGAKGGNVAGRVDGVWVQRRRSKAENVYQVGDREPHQLERGGAVPKAVAGLLNLSPLNFAGQHDAAFWLSDTPGRVAQALNEIVSLQEIDEVTAKASAAVRDAQAQVRAADLEAAEANAELERRPDVAGLSEQLAALDDLLRRRDAAADRANRLRDLLGRLADAADRRRDLAAVVAAGERAEAAVGSLTATSARLAALRGILSALSAPRADVDGAAWDRVLAARAAANAAAERRAALDAELHTYLTAVEKSCRAKALAEQAESELAALTESLGGLCPTCGRPADPSQFLSATPTSDPDRPPPGERTRGAGVDFK